MRSPSRSHLTKLRVRISVSGSNERTAITQSKFSRSEFFKKVADYLHCLDHIVELNAFGIAVFILIISPEPFLVF